MEKRFQVSINSAKKEYLEDVWVEVILTDEGIIIDVYRNDEDAMADCITTIGHTWNELELVQPKILEHQMQVECDIHKLVKAANEADKFFQDNDDFTENGEFPIPEFIQNLRESAKKVTK